MVACLRTPECHASPRLASLAAGIGLFWSSVAAACDWNANLNLTPATVHESGALTFTWGAVANCNAFTLHHYLIAFNDTATPTTKIDATPLSSSDGSVFLPASSATTSTQFVHRSQWTYYAKIWACQRASCTDYYGLGPGETGPTNIADSGATDQEVWILTGVASSADTDSYVALYAANAPSAFFYPPDSLTYAYTYT